MRKVLVLAALVGLLAGPSFGEIVYLNDDFNIDFQGWTPYSNSGQQTEHGHPGAPTVRTGSGIHGWDPPVSPPAALGWEYGGASVFDTGYGYSGIAKGFQDEYLPNETKYFEITYRAIGDDGWTGALRPVFTVWLGVDPTGGTDRDAASVEWYQVLENPPGSTPWTTAVVERPCEEAWETIFFEVRWTFINGYNVFDVDHVKVWQTPEPASALLIGLAGLPLLRRRRR